LKPKRSFQRLEQRGALGEKRIGSEVVVVMEVLIFLGEVVAEEEEVVGLK
jgi:hypothetical protein